MSKDQSEEKTLPASEKKLRDSRKKGQVSQSKDMVSAVGTVATMLYLWLAWDTIQQSMMVLLILPSDAYDMPFMAAVDRVAGHAFDLAVLTVMPLISIVVLTSILTNAAVMRGFTFSTDPIKPKGDNINPVSGFKKLFSLKNLVELLKSILKTVLLAAAAIVLILLGLETLMKGPFCGPECVAFSFGIITKPLFIAIALIFLAFAMFDVGIQRWLFLRDMRMTKTEFKRERKDMEGDPTVRQERSRRRQEFAQGAATPLGLRHATLMIADRSEVVIGLRFVEGETPVPVIVCKGRKARALDLLVDARRLYIPVFDDAALADGLAKKGGLGGDVAEKVFPQVAHAILQAS
ncbi:MAG: EscU/YscU/HrcU family type III secretion system export apparatus switch protein [Geminicoccaceae bacterium]